MMCSGTVSGRVPEHSSDSSSRKGPRGPLDLPDDDRVWRPGPRRPDVRVGIVADELPGALRVPAGALDDEAAAALDLLEQVERAATEARAMVLAPK